MDDDAFGLVAWILIAVGGLIALIVVAGGIMYAADTTVGATVTDTRCGGIVGGGSEVDVKTRFPVPGIDHTVTGISNEVCNTLATLKSANGKDPFAEYSIRSGRTVLYDAEGGDCLYDSKGKLC